MKRYTFTMTFESYADIMIDAESQEEAQDKLDSISIWELKKFCRAPDGSYLNPNSIEFYSEENLGETTTDD